MKRMKKHRPIRGGKFIFFLTAHLNIHTKRKINAKQQAAKFIHNIKLIYKYYHRISAIFNWANG